LFLKAELKMKRTQISISAAPLRLGLSPEVGEKLIASAKNNKQIRHKQTA
jgi:hypothetical protein